MCCISLAFSLSLFRYLRAASMYTLTRARTAVCLRVVHDAFLLLCPRRSIEFGWWMVSDLRCSMSSIWLRLILDVKNHDLSKWQCDRVHTLQHKKYAIIFRHTLTWFNSLEVHSAIENMLKLICFHRENYPANEIGIHSFNGSHYDLQICDS